MSWLDDLEGALGRDGLWRPDRSPPDDLTPWLTDWRGRYQGRALAMARPKTVDEVCAVVRACAAEGVAIVPQGGNTGLVGGGVPDDTGRQLLLNLSRLNRLRQLDPAAMSLTVEAGCTLSQVQQAAEAADLLFPLSLAAEGTCTIGGNLATNAGGTQVLRYGTARALCLGLEVVTARGEVWSGLSGVLKNNTGYDLRDLFIGSEGTLGVITAATLRLHPRPQGCATALVACASVQAAVDLLLKARRAVDAGLTAFELMARHPLALVQKHLPDAAACLEPASGAGSLPPRPSWTVLIEACSSESDEHAQGLLLRLLNDGAAAGLVLDARLASNLVQQQAMWRLREAIPLAEKAEGVMVKHDIAVPSSSVPAFLTRVEPQLQDRWPGCRTVCFGHLGDGNLHYNVQPPAAPANVQRFEDFERGVNAVVFDEVQALGGALSAEHGIGQLRRDELARRHAPVALDMMRAIKRALDPQGLFNPGRVV